MLLWYFYFLTPQYVYYVIPMSALVATLVTIGLMTKNSELIVMRACGISLYRAALPLLGFALAASGVLFVLQEQVIAFSNREADRLNRQIRNLPAQAGSVMDRRWIIATNGDIYHYDFFEPARNQFTRLSMYHLDDRAWRLGSLTYARSVRLVRENADDGQPALVWRAEDGWTRDLVPPGRRRADRSTIRYDTFKDRNLTTLEPPSYFTTAEPEPELMTYRELRGYIDTLRVSGFNATKYMVALQRKVAFPLVTVVMTLLAVPFAVTTGRRGAMYGIGVGIVLAIVYWLTLSVFAAVGAGGWLSPMLAAWAPNILFSAAAAYLLLTVRT